MAVKTRKKKSSAIAGGKYGRFQGRRILSRILNCNLWYLLSIYQENAPFHAYCKSIPNLLPFLSIIFVLLRQLFTEGLMIGYKKVKVLVFKDFLQKVFRVYSTIAVKEKKG